MCGFDVLSRHGKCSRGRPERETQRGTYYVRPVGSSGKQIWNGNVPMHHMLEKRKVRTRADTCFAGVRSQIGSRQAEDVVAHYSSLFEQFRRAPLFAPSSSVISASRALACPLHICTPSLLTSDNLTLPCLLVPACLPLARLRFDELVNDS